MTNIVFISEQFAFGLWEFLPPHWSCYQPTFQVWVLPGVKESSLRQVSVSGAWPRNLEQPLLSWILYRRFGLSLPGVVHMIIAVHLCILAATDIMYRLLPNRILLSASVFAVFLRVVLCWATSRVAVPNVAKPDSE